MSSTDSPRKEIKRSRLPWILLLLLILGVYVFWVLPSQLGSRKVQVQHETASKK